MDSPVCRVTPGFGWTPPSENRVKKCPPRTPRGLHHLLKKKRKANSKMDFDLIKSVTPFRAFTSKKLSFGKVSDIRSASKRTNSCDNKENVLNTHLRNQQCKVNNIPLSNHLSTPLSSRLPSVAKENSSCECPVSPNNDFSPKKMLQKTDSSSSFNCSVIAGHGLVPVSNGRSRDRLWHRVNQKEVLESTRVVQDDPTAVTETPARNSFELPGRDVATCASKRKNVYQSYRGQLKVKIYVHYGHLTVHVVEARHLCSRKKKICNSYVKLSLLPDHTGKAKCKTAVEEGSNAPIYDEKFSFELLEEDKEKRLLVSMWNQHPKKNGVEFLGCMSFGIQNMLNKEEDVDGWYYLLSENTGLYKHLRAAVSSKKSPTSSLTNVQATPGRVNGSGCSDLNTVVISRGKQGYGFSLTGHYPAIIGRVDYASPAYEAGLRPGDQVVGVGGQRVHRMASDSVARVIRHYQNQVIVDFIRPSSLSKTPCRSPTEYLDSSTDDSDSDFSDAENSLNFNQSKENCPGLLRKH